ncbi:hypothetical protein NQZ68_013600 [Dissostichus eleginoides]|nr:hypothetical protein NQZ68_013600 [Dissostichus eleginoides]
MQDLQGSATHTSGLMFRQEGESLTRNYDKERLGSPFVALTARHFSGGGGTGLWPVGGTLICLACTSPLEEEKVSDYPAELLGAYCLPIRERPVGEVVFLHSPLILPPELFVHRAAFSLCSEVFMRVTNKGGTGRKKQKEDPEGERGRTLSNVSTAVA